MTNQEIFLPNYHQKHQLIITWQSIFRDVWQYRHFIQQMSRVTLFNEYKKSWLGKAWIFLSPIFANVLWLFLNASGIVNPGDTGIPYPAFTLLSTVIWGFFINFYVSISNTIAERSGILLQTKFPYIAIVLEKMIVQFINLTIPLVLSILILKLFGVKLTLASFLFPFLIIPLILLGSGLGLLFSVLKIVAIDLTNLFDRLIGITMFFTPIVYGKNVDSLLLQTLMKYNPLTYLVSYPRDILINTHSVEFSTYCFCAILSILFFVWAVHFFCKITPIVIQRIIL